MSEKLYVEMYTDGACSGNPGAGGYGTILRYQDKSGTWHEKELTAGYKLTTNNRMELLAVIVGLKALKEKCEVDIYSDSQYVVDAFKQNWILSWQMNGWRTAGKKEVKNVDLWKELLELVNMHVVDFIKVKGHSDNENNNRCDKIAVNEYKKLQLNEQV